MLSPSRLRVASYHPASEDYGGGGGDDDGYGDGDYGGYGGYGGGGGGYSKKSEGPCWVCQELGKWPRDHWQRNCRARVTRLRTAAIRLTGLT